MLGPIWRCWRLLLYQSGQFQLPAYLDILRTEARGGLGSSEHPGRTVSNLVHGGPAVQTDLVLLALQCHDGGGTDSSRLYCSAGSRTRPAHTASPRYRHARLSGAAAPSGSTGLHSHCHTALTADRAGAGRAAKHFSLTSFLPSLLPLISLARQNCPLVCSASPPCPLTVVLARPDVSRGPPRLSSC